ncbi:MAG: Stp1/IreP family PP2C-type Ser/Thr phosphatase [Gammaproteobacteria bacterium]
MNLKGKIAISGRTDTGRVRSHNEDSIGDDIEIGCVALADGMGGYKGGEVASAIAINTIIEHLGNELPRLKNAGEMDEETGYTKESLILRDSILLGNKAIYETARSQPQYQGMGTTIVLAGFYDNRLTVAHVGDSRMYRIRSGRMEQITADHSLLQELVDRGFYSSEEAKESLNKNLVTRALGIEPTVAVDINEDLVLPGDVYMMCSDGLNDMVEDEDIRLTIQDYGANLDETADRLIKLANDNGGKDNISVMLVRILKAFPAE